MSAAPTGRMSADERREQITGAARRVFVRQGLAGARTKDIAAEAGVTEALLYRHFASKQDLFDAAVAGPLDAAVAELVERSGDPPPHFDTTGEEMFLRTERFVGDLLDVMGEVGPLLGVMLFGDASEAEDYYRERIAPAIAGVRSVVEANIASWSHAEFDTELVVSLTFGGAWFIRLGDRLADRDRDTAATARQITEVLLRGLALPDDA